MRNMPPIADLDLKIPLNFFSRHNLNDKKTKLEMECNHLGFLVKDGFNFVDGNKIQRIQCSACNKRFGNSVSMYQLLSYQNQLKELIYELIFSNYRETEMAARWKIPQPKLSQFKKMCVMQIVKDHPNLLQSKSSMLPRGVVLADETYMGRKGNSNTEIHMINAEFQSIATGSAPKGELAESIQKVFLQIPEPQRKKMKLLITDGENSYGPIAMNANSRVIHVQQLHAKPLLGQVIINKYRKFGPHYLHYMIKTHWKAFNQGSKVLGFNWEIKFIKGVIQIGRGRPKKSDEQSNKLRVWRQKKNKYYSNAFKKSGYAEIFFNAKTKKISKRAGASQWMLEMLQPVQKFFKEKCITSNQVESKHSQIKRKGASRKQPDSQYADALFRVCAYVAEHNCIPRFTIKGRPLFKYLIDARRPLREYYVFPKKNSISKQLLLSAFIE